MTASVRRFGDAFGFVFGAWRVRPRGKRILTALSIVLMLSGAGMFSYPFLTDLYTKVKQGQLQDDFTSPEFQDRLGSGAVVAGEVLTRIRIPKIGVDALIVEGSDPGALRAGAGHYPNTALPCDEGNVGIAGHRTTYGKPFNRLDELVAGDTITLEMPGRTCTYTVVEGEAGKPKPRPKAAGWITDPRDGGVLSPMQGRFLTLTTCHPKGSAAKRLILRAQIQG